MTEPVEVGPACVVLGDPFLGELAGLDVGQNLGHGPLRRVGDNLRAPREAAILGGVADGVPHPGLTASLHHVDDELELVQALEVGHLGLIPRRDKGLEPGVDKRRYTPAEHSLLTEQVALGLLLERGDQRTGLGPADGLRIRLDQVPRLPRRILCDGDQDGRPLPCFVLPSHRVPRRLWRDHRHIDVRRRLDIPEVHIESMREEQRIPRLQIRPNGLGIQLPLPRIRRQHHNQIGPAAHLLGRPDSQPLFFRFGPRLGPFVQSHPHIAPAVTKTERMRMPLGPVPEHCDLATLHQPEVSLIVVIHRGH